MMDIILTIPRLHTKIISRLDEYTMTRLMRTSKTMLFIIGKSIFWSCHSMMTESFLASSIIDHKKLIDLFLSVKIFSNLFQPRFYYGSWYYTCLMNYLYLNETNTLSINDLIQIKNDFPKIIILGTLLQSLENLDFWENISVPICIIERESRKIDHPDVQKILELCVVDVADSNIKTHYRQHINLYITLSRRIPDYECEFTYYVHDSFEKDHIYISEQSGDLERFSKDNISKKLETIADRFEIDLIILKKMLQIILGLSVGGNVNHIIEV